MRICEGRATTSRRSRPSSVLRADPIVALIEEGQRRGEMRSDHDAAFLAQMAVGMLNSAITSWFANPDYPVESGLVEATEFTLDTLGAKRA